MGSFYKLDEYFLTGFLGVMLVLLCNYKYIFYS